MPLPHDTPKITRWFLAAVALVALIYVCFDLTPSSYGVFLDAIQAPDAGPVMGVARSIRADEWSVNTPLFQAAVRNKFQRINETSFYREDLRNFVALPLKDWSLIFKPQLWAFFLLRPSTAYSIYWAFYMCAFLIGYYFLFHELGAPRLFAIAATIIVYFSGFAQFWWTTLGPLLAGLPWLLLIALRPMPWWKKALLYVWALPTLVFGYVYPIPLMTLAWGALIVILAFRPAALRSPGNIVAIGIGALALAAVLAFYYGGVITIIRNTVYPGHRISRSGTASGLAVLSEFFPFVSFRLGNFQHLDGENICEIGALGSFLPLLTLCLMRYRAVRDDAPLRRTLLVLLAGFAVITLWELAPLPAWFGHMLLWDRGPAERWLFISGFLLTLAALAIWNKNLISVDPLRITIFVLLGQVAALFLKIAWLVHKGESAGAAFGECSRDVLLCGFAVAAAAAAWYLPDSARALLLLVAISFMNVYAFAGFNPLQPAGPIFDVPETDIVHGLREKAEASPGGILTTQSLGATLNGLGFRSVSHVLMVPELAFLRAYFPAMDSARFNQIFNRYAHIQAAPIAQPRLVEADLIEVPIEPFTPVRNVRRVDPGPSRPRVCAQPPGGGIDRISSQDGALTIVGWAPWNAETTEQGLRLLTARPLRPATLTTIPRPDIAERLKDYSFVKSGFQLQISASDSKPLRPEDLVLLAFGTAQGELRLSCCGCP